MTTLRFACVADDSAKAKEALAVVAARHTLSPISHRKDAADVIVVFGGDGFMLQCLHKYMKYRIPFYGINCGTVGFLLNDPSQEDIVTRLRKARPATLFPLHMYAERANGRPEQALAFNEVSLFRQSRQAAKICISVDHVVRIPELIADGALLATAAGSTAYNFSAGGPIIPFGANVVALTPLVPFRPRRWRGALLPHSATFNFDILEAAKRPVSAVADFTEVRDVVAVAVSEQRKHGVNLLFDPDRNFEERILREQFSH